MPALLQASAEEGEEGGLQDADVAKPAARIDGGDLRRETLFSLENQQLSWLSESDMPQENEPESNAEELDVVKVSILCRWWREGRHYTSLLPSATALLPSAAALPSCRDACC